MKLLFVELYFTLRRYIFVFSYTCNSISEELISAKFISLGYCIFDAVKMINNFHCSFCETNIEIKFLKNMTTMIRPTSVHASA